ncbi:hypothetical protein F2Q68_00032487 [Brassica cretica]|nr:hypothetical protein F2Q68_00032487 [Brassica cretica]
MKDGFTIRKPSRIHSRACARSSNEAKRKGCHSGYGKRQETDQGLVVDKENEGVEAFS